MEKTTEFMRTVTRNLSTTSAFEEFSAGFRALGGAAEAGIAAAVESAMRKTGRPKA